MPKPTTYGVAREHHSLGLAMLVWEEQAYASPGEYDRFIQYIEGQVAPESLGRWPSIHCTARA